VGGEITFLDLSTNLQSNKAPEKASKVSQLNWRPGRLPRYDESTLRINNKGKDMK